MKMTNIKRRAAVHRALRKYRGWLSPERFVRARLHGVDELRVAKGKR